MSFMETMGFLAFCSTLGMYMTSLPLFTVLLKLRQPARVQFSALAMNLLNNLFGLHYAIEASVTVSRITNTIGICLHLLLSLSFIMVTNSRRLPLTLLCVAFASFGASWYFLPLVDAGDVLDDLGLISSTVRTLAYTTPVLTVINAIQTGSLEGISVSLACGSFVCNSIWFLYGGLLQDVYIQLPNIPGIAVHLSALFLVWRERDTKTEHQLQNGVNYKKTE
jgi:solute carrier family 50 protein (sugar transporter)